MDLVEPFVALVIYPTTREAQSRQADNLVRIASQKLSSLPGFLRGRVYVSENGDSLVTLTEWRDRASFQSFRQSEFGHAAVLLTAPLHPKAYWLRQHSQIEAGPIKGLARRGPPGTVTYAAVTSSAASSGPWLAAYDRAPVLSAAKSCLPRVDSERPPVTTRGKAVHKSGVLMEPKMKIGPGNRLPDEPWTPSEAPPGVDRRTFMMRSAAPQG